MSDTAAASARHGMEVQPARADDVDRIIELTRARRRALARWAPTYFNPSEGADERHAAWLAFLVGSADHETSVIVEGGEVVGFFAEVEQPRHLWIDDLCLASHHDWADVVDLVADGLDRPWVTCVPTGDRDLARALDTRGVRARSRYFARSLDDVAPRPAGPVAELPDDPDDAPRHTFGGRSLDAALPGALVVATPDGHLVGSPSATPPLYDPGGPTCVVDRIVGRDRAALVEEGMAVAAGRGDAQLVVVCDAEDESLESILRSRGFSAVVTLQGTPTRAER